MDTLVVQYYGALAFPSYETILADPKSTDDEICGVFRYLYMTKEPKHQFRAVTASFLAHKNDAVRVCAIVLLRQIGTPSEGSVLVALLSDRDPINSYEAARTLAKIGGQSEVLALDAWLRGGGIHRNRPDLLEHVQKCRDELAKRLEELAKQEASK